MKKSLSNRLLFVFLFQFVLLATEAQIRSFSIEGKWIYKGGSDNKSSAAECPDVLAFEANGKYAVINDCYGKDPSNAVVETGKWKVTGKGNQMILFDRNIQTGYVPNGSLSILNVLYIKRLDQKVLEISFDPNRRAVERYVRVEIE